MSRTFYTERDIEDLAKRGVTEIEINDSVYITDVAREMMDKLGIKRKVTSSASASSSVLKSPDVANLHAQSAPNAPASNHASLTDAEKQEVIEKVKSGVIARLGAGVDSAVVEQIVKRVVGKL
jgi:hypothetical protein